MPAASERIRPRRDGAGDAVPLAAHVVGRDDTERERAGAVRARPSADDTSRIAARYAITGILTRRAESDVPLA